MPFQALVRGLSDDVNLDTFDNDPLPVMFPLIDLTFIVTILLSLAALILSYDAVCGEKEDGTLKLMLANGLPRFKIVSWARSPAERPPWSSHSSSRWRRA